MKKFICFFIIASMCGNLTACHQRGGATATREESKSYPIHLSDPQKAFVCDNNAFSLQFIKKVNDADASGKSFIYSPLSITYALSMVNAAAAGTTQQELEQTLGFREGGPQAVNDFCKTLIDSLPMADKRVQLHIANAIFVNQDYQLKKAFLQDMQHYYKALAESLDFTSLRTPGHINGWCSKKTHGMIPSILGEIDPSAVSYLLNAIYFKADWTTPFEKKRTKNEDFTTENGPVKMPLMRQTEEFQYMNNGTFAAVRLPYGNGQWDMTVMLPENGNTPSDLIDYLAQNGMPSSDQFRFRQVDLKLPRFETESTTGDLIGTLEKMGIKKVFDENASEVPNLCDKSVFINMMLQKARITVNESGSEAAAVTAVEVFECLAVADREEPVVFHANRPFVYVIREISTGVILFVGKYTGK